mgnify:CR=1 FL=1
MIDRKHFFDTLKKSLVNSFTASQVEGFTAILDEYDSKSFDKRYLAYMLATVYHETAKTMQPIAEYGKGKGKPYGKMIKMNGGTKKVKTMTVAPQNDSVTYQNYLERVQALSDHLTRAVGKAVSPHETEELIFSFSGTPSKKGRLNEAQHSAVSAWRRYLRTTTYIIEW